GVQAGGCARASGDPFEPAVDVPEAAVDRLAHTTAEICGAVEDDVGDREAGTDDPGLPSEQSVQPGEGVANRRLQTLRCLGQDAQAWTEELDPFGEAKAVVEMLRDPELDASLPAAGFRPLLRRRPHEGRHRVLLFQVLEDGDRLADDTAVVHLE